MATQEVSFQPIGHSQQQNSEKTAKEASLFNGRTISRNIYDVDCQNIAKRADRAADSTGGP